MEHIIVTPQYKKHVALIQLNRPKELNALHPPLMKELETTITQLDHDKHVRTMVITGSTKAFAAGADIKQMAHMSALEIQKTNFLHFWDRIGKTNKPLIAAVSGFALGGGCELALACDMIVASETAQFGQPEIKIGTIPGAGGTQRLTRIVGKAKAMELILTGRLMPATEAMAYGIINKIVPIESYLKEAVAMASEIARQPHMAVLLAKQAILRSYETVLEEGLLFERKNFYLTFTSEDQKEGMQAFIEKRKPRYQDQ